VFDIAHFRCLYANDQRSPAAFITLATLRFRILPAIT